MSCRFNSRAHGGRDTKLANAGLLSYVSIHAPTGGATGTALEHVHGVAGFNSRAHGGRDSLGGRFRREDPVSIHAPTGGATPRASCTGLGGGFQFTRPRGARLGGRYDFGRLNEFQFTRPRGARLTRLSESPSSLLFQFTRPRGARLTPPTAPAEKGVSIHAPTGGAT